MNIDIKTPVAILGFGVEGRAALEFLGAQGISDITIFDQSTHSEIPEGLSSKLGPNAFDDLGEFETIIRSPGVHYNLPSIVEAKDRGAMITSMTDLTLEVARSRLTAITGSNGKTTVTTMLDKILTRHYAGKLIVGGNDREPILQKAINRPLDPVLLEVSSFQFADLHKSPHISAVLNISPNHLDWHENLEDYIHAKGNLIAHQTKDDWAVLNASNEDSAKLAEHAPGQIFWLNKKEGPAWVIWSGDELIASWQGTEISILKKGELKVKTHPDNILCAAAISLIHGASAETIRAELSTFTGVEHRLEFVRELDGVNYYNDSACTTPESAMVAIDQFEPGTLILFLGGSSKGADFSFLAHHITKSKTRVLPYGHEAPKIQEAVSEDGGSSLIIEAEDTTSFITVIETARAAAHPGDNIVLSPACASFDMFKNSKARGQTFKRIVNSL
ncbi:MAG: UDP-N-acetylmuramoyl-L-alanine--D-glutamate ligase [Candidatus Peregrinibacteria bacterium]|nr:UDP-N-acetylmuramoyl-L-alanine--D-glutamate ligase [Candidatus Peregrinibacteria bacterium]